MGAKGAIAIPLLGIVPSIICLLHRAWKCRSLGTEEFLLYQLERAQDSFGIDSSAAGSYMYWIGLYYKDQDNLPKALYYFERVSSLPICKQDYTGAPYQCMTGSVCSELGHFEDALQHFDLALILALGKSGKVKPRIVHQVRRLIGKTLTMMGRHFEALQHYRAVLTDMKKSGEIQSIRAARLLLLTGSELRSLGRLDEAASTLVEGLEIVRVNTGGANHSLEVELSESLEEIHREREP